MEVVRIPTGELFEYEWNAKMHREEQVEEIAASILEFGFADPIEAWRDGEGRAIVVAGHGRLRAAKRLRMKTVPVIFLSLTDSQRRAYGLVHNKVQQDTGFDYKRLTKDLSDIDGYEWANFGFDDLVFGEARSEQDDWEPIVWDDEDTDEVLKAKVVTVRCKGDSEKEAMRQKVGGDTLKRMYRVGDMR